MTCIDIINGLKWWNKDKTFINSLFKDWHEDFLGCKMVIRNELPVWWKHLIELNFRGNFHAHSLAQIGLRKSQHFYWKNFKIFVFLGQLIILVIWALLLQKLCYVRTFPQFLLYYLVIFVMVYLKDPVNQIFVITAEINRVFQIFVFLLVSEIKLSQSFLHCFAELRLWPFTHHVETLMQSKQVESQPLYFYQTKSKYFIMVFIFLVFKNLHKRLSIKCKCS